MPLPPRWAAVAVFRWAGVVVVLPENRDFVTFGVTNGVIFVGKCWLSGNLRLGQGCLRRPEFGLRNLTELTFPFLAARSIVGRGVLD